jgi:hypothetical protein
VVSKSDSDPDIKDQYIFGPANPDPPFYSALILSIIIFLF